MRRHFAASQPTILWISRFNSTGLNVKFVGLKMSKMSFFRSYVSRDFVGHKTFFASITFILQVKHVILWVYRRHFVSAKLPFSGIKDIIFRVAEFISGSKHLIAPRV